MVNINQVIEGLSQGSSYRHQLSGGGWEYLRPIYTPDMCAHTVVGKDFGGYAELDVLALKGKGWEIDGWEIIT